LRAARRRGITGSVPTAIVVAIAVLRPASDGADQDYELRVGTLDQPPEDAAAYVAVASIPDLLDVVLALGAGLSA
jgi:hypothetical protein